MTGRRGRTAALAALLAASPAACGGEPGGDRTASVSFTVEEGSVEAAARVLRDRALALGLDPGEAAIEGRRVTFEVARRATAKEHVGLTQHAYLTFRVVRQALAPQATAPGEAGGGDCADPAYRTQVARAHRTAAADSRAVVTCDVVGAAKYVLEPAAFTPRDVRDATAPVPAVDADTGWIVRLELADSARWASFTGANVGRQVAIVRDGLVQMAPTVNEPIPDGAVEISGSFDETHARVLAACLRGGPLPERVLPA